MAAQQYGNGTNSESVSACVLASASSWGFAGPQEKLLCRSHLPISSMAHENWPKKSAKQWRLPCPHWGKTIATAVSYWGIWECSAPKPVPLRLTICCYWTCSKPPVPEHDCRETHGKTVLAVWTPSILPCSHTAWCQVGEWWLGSQQPVAGYLLAQGAPVVLLALCLRLSFTGGFHEGAAHRALIQPGAEVKCYLFLLCLGSVNFAGVKDWYLMSICFMFHNLRVFWGLLPTPINEN